MRDAKALLSELLAVIPNGDRVAALFAEDGVVEIPFLHTLGMPARYHGRTQIRDFYNQVGKLYADFGFTPQDTKVLIATLNQVFAEYMTHAKAAGTRRPIHPLFAGRLVAENGQITLLRESMNPLAAVQALNPKGAAGLPPPPAEVFSVPPDYVS
jgi:ketosteroid isomerase-like protein